MTLVLQGAGRAGYRMVVGIVHGMACRTAGKYHHMMSGWGDDMTVHIVVAENADHGFCELYHQYCRIVGPLK